ncbi:hypothetical protein HK104_004198 [Borealophlyctis nickersoniae]|nr:hypothetical protein HK104_004198 [Borealophlyctis nickersoniae]
MRAALLLYRGARTVDPALPVLKPPTKEIFLQQLRTQSILPEGAAGAEIADVLMELDDGDAEANVEEDDSEDGGEELDGDEVISNMDKETLDACLKLELELTGDLENANPEQTGLRASRDLEWSQSLGRVRSLLAELKVATSSLKLNQPRYLVGDQKHSVELALAHLGAASPHFTDAAKYLAEVQIGLGGRKQGRVAIGKAGEEFHPLELEKKQKRNASYKTL